MARRYMHPLRRQRRRTELSRTEALRMAGAKYAKRHARDLVVQRGVSEMERWEPDK